VVLLQLFPVYVEEAVFRAYDKFVVVCLFGHGRVHESSDLLHQGLLPIHLNEKDFIVAIFHVQIS